MRVLVMTDVAGSTRLWLRHPRVMHDVMSRHHRIVHDAIAAHGGHRPVDQGEGDAVFAVFDSAVEAVEAVVELQRRLEEEPWPEGIAIRDRVGVHAGGLVERDGNVFGASVSRAARIRGLGAGGQVLLSSSVADLLETELPPGLELVDLGEHRLKDFDRAERVFQLVAPGLPAGFPPLPAAAPAAAALPVPATAMIGRQTECSDVLDLLDRARVVTLTGFGGMGKTRLALEIAGRSVGRFPDGVHFVDLSAVLSPGDVPAALGAALGVEEGPSGPLLALQAALGPQTTLVVLDNVEQLLPEIAGVIDDLTTRAAGLRVLATSREPVGARLEHRYPLDPLPLPGSAPGTGLEDLAACPSVALLVERASAARRGFALTPENASAIAAICSRLDGYPLALELAASRLRVLSPAALLGLLDRALAVLSGDSRDPLGRQRALRATVTTSVDGLAPEHRDLFAALAVFPGSFDLAAATAVAGGGEDAVLEVLDGLAEMIDRGLVRMASSDDDERYGLLAPIREYASELLARAGRTEEVEQRHATHYVGLVLPSSATSREEAAARERTALEEWHNLRVCADRLHRAGREDDEVALATAVVSPALAQGQVGEARGVIDHALTHLPPHARSVEDVLLILAKVDVEWSAFEVEWSSFRVENARAWALRAVSEARELDDPLLTSLALSRAAVFAETRHDRDLLREEGERLLAEGRGSVPGWRVRDSWQELLASTWFLDADQAETMLRERLLTADGDDVFRARYELACLLYNRSRFADAAELLAPFESPEGEPRAPATVSVQSTYLAATLRTLGGDPAGALADLDLADDRASRVDMPDLRLLADIQRASVERVAGRATAAERRVRSILATELDENTRTQHAYAAWLLAVLLRERGEHEEARRRLADAWTITADDQWNYDLVLQCLLERAVQIEDADPLQAARLVASVVANRNEEVFYHGVDYAPEAWLARLRDRLGAEVVEPIARSAGEKPVPREPWA